jgi:hypothetical protein
MRDDVIAYHGFAWMFENAGFSEGRAGATGGRYATRGRPPTLYLRSHDRSLLLPE